MMTQSELTTTKTQLDAALKQINSLAILVQAQLCPNASGTDIRSVQLNAMITIFDSVCPVTVKMVEFNDKKSGMMQWFSESFYTHNKGYKMCLSVDAGGYGDGKGTHLSMFLYLMKGSHDDELTWPLRGKFKIKLLNQISDSEHHSKTVTYDDDDDFNRVTEGDRDNGWGDVKYISIKGLYRATPACQYLKDNCLFFQVIKL